MLKGSCHCGAVTLTVTRRPRRVTVCNCSICRRVGGLWAYYRLGEVTVEAAPGATQSYIWGDKTIDNVRCATCGCVTHWVPLAPKADSKMGVNTRIFDPDALGTPRIRRFDGAVTWRYLD